MVEHRTVNAVVAGSSPAIRAISRFTAAVRYGILRAMKATGHFSHHGRCRVATLFAVVAFAVGIATAATWHVDSAAGDDAADGASPETAWRTLDRVNKAALRPGDRMLFKRGGLWRGTLRPASGAPGRPITYSWYGQGPQGPTTGSKCRPGCGQRAGRASRSTWAYSSATTGSGGA